MSNNVTRQEFADYRTEQRPWEYCPKCGGFGSLTPVFSGEDNEFRCFSCLGLCLRVCIPIEAVAKGQGNDDVPGLPTPAQLRKYADFLEAKTPPIDPYACSGTTGAYTSD